uniref:RCC1-like domain-containing protein n=1 Tax=Arcella intermedia TaxID=1963864 RepID=A0A6B2LHV3_9EUKA
MVVPPLIHPYSKEPEKVVKVVGGCFHAMALTEAGNLYGWGSNKKGQLGAGWEVKVSLVPLLVPVPVLGNDRIVDVSLGLEHSLILTSTGSVYSCGSNSYGELGTGTRENVFIPKKVLSLSNISQIYTGDSHSFAVDGKGILYSWGLGTDYQLGDNKLSVKMTPSSDIQLPKNMEIISIAAGAYHSLVLLHENEM